MSPVQSVTYVSERSFNDLCYLAVRLTLPDAGCHMVATKLDKSRADHRD